MEGSASQPAHVEDVLFTSVSQDAMSPLYLLDTSSFLHICEAADQIKGAGCCCCPCLSESLSDVRDLENYPRNS